MTVLPRNSIFDSLFCENVRGVEGIGDELRAFRRRLDMTQEQMAEKLGLKRTTYTAYEQGLSNVPQAIFAQLQKMGFGAAPEVGNPLFPVAVPRTLIPRSPAVPCSDWSDPLDTDYTEFEEVDSFMAGKGRFACEVVGDSMYDLLWPGDMCIWQQSHNPKLGTVVIAVNRDRQATAAQLKHDGEQFILHKLNPRYPDAESDHWECVGFLVGIIRVQGTKRVTVYDPQGIRP